MYVKRLFPVCIFQPRRSLNESWCDLQYFLVVHLWHVRAMRLF